MEKKRILHLYNRFGFGLSAQELDNLVSEDFAVVLRQEKLEFSQLDMSEFDNLPTGKMTKDEKRSLRKQFRSKLMELNVYWLKKMITSPNMVRERMTLFWHHHFACIIDNPIYAQQFSNAIRMHAIGDFKSLLLAVSKSAAMIDFLHTKQNKKRSPNEDFARELCELYTLGRDRGYSESDVGEIARCFTGWNHRKDGSFFIQERQRDLGVKEVFGQKGNFGGEDVIDLILQKRACAQFICENFYQYFIHPDIDEERVQQMTDLFYNSEYDIEQLILFVVRSDWFYEQSNVLAKVKSPIELLVGLGRQFHLDNEKDKSWIFLQRILGQVLYQPPNVEGWRQDKEWIDSNSLPLRLRLPSILLTNAELTLEQKPDYDQNPNSGKGKNKMTKRLGFSHDWDYFFERNRGIDYEDLFFLGVLSKQAEAFLSSKTFSSPYEQIIQLISLPEYQLT